jgi:hypothetical protein
MLPVQRLIVLNLVVTNAISFEALLRLAVNVRKHHKAPPG